MSRAESPEKIAPTVSSAVSGQPEGGVAMRTKHRSSCSYQGYQWSSGDHARGVGQRY